MSEKLILNCERVAIALCVINGILLFSAFILPTIDPSVLGYVSAGFISRLG